MDGKGLTLLAFTQTRGEDTIMEYRLHETVEPCACYRILRQYVETVGVTVQYNQ